MSDTESPEPNSPIFELTDEAVTTQTNFKDRIQTARQEIQTKFIGFRDQLKQEETRLLDKLNEIENEILTKFELSSRTLFEISQARKQIISTLKSNTTNTLLKKNLKMYDEEIETITKKSKIDSSTVQLKWNVIKFEKLCELTLVTEQMPTLNLPEFPEIIDPLPTEPEILEYPPQYNIQPQRYAEIPRQPEISLGYHNVISPYTQLPATEREYQSPTGQSVWKKRKHDSDSRWKCPYCSSFNLMKYSFCETCYKAPEQPDSPTPQIPASHLRFISDP